MVRRGGGRKNADASDGDESKEGSPHIDVDDTASSDHEMKKNSEEKKDSDDGDDSDDGEEDDYEVENIIKKRKIRGVLQYWVKWKGYEESENTWEPAENLNCDELVREFEEAETKKAGKPKTTERARPPLSRSPDRDSKSVSVKGDDSSDDEEYEAGSKRKRKSDTGKRTNKKKSRATVDDKDDISPAVPSRNKKSVSPDDKWLLERGSSDSSRSPSPMSKKKEKEPSSKSTSKHTKEPKAKKGFVAGKRRASKSSSPALTASKNVFENGTADLSDEGESSRRPSGKRNGTSSAGADDGEPYQPYTVHVEQQVTAAPASTSVGSASRKSAGSGSRRSLVAADNPPSSSSRRQNRSSVTNDIGGAISTGEWDTKKRVRRVTGIHNLCGGGDRASSYERAIVSVELSDYNDDILTAKAIMGCQPSQHRERKIGDVNNSDQTNGRKQTARQREADVAVEREKVEQVQQGHNEVETRELGSGHLGVSVGKV